MGFENEYDFRSGHANTFEWFMEEGMDRIGENPKDPLWGGGWDFEREAEAAAEIRGG